MKQSYVTIGSAVLLLMTFLVALVPIESMQLQRSASAASNSITVGEPVVNARSSALTAAAPLSQTMTISQTLSDEAQRNTIAFDGLAFLTGSLGADSFFPPGKVADFWGFQYLRDNDPSQMGHNPLFLTSAAFNMWNVLTTDQRAQLRVLADNQVSAIDDYAYRRFVLIKAFRRLLEGDVPTGSLGLDKAAVMAYSAELYQLDGQLSYDRAQVMGGILATLSTSQTTFLNTNMVGKGMLEWPTVTEPADMQGLARAVKEALMTYAGDMYSWYAGSLEADVYFCPERQGTYFGSFYLKDTPVMSTGGTIDPNLTATAGITFLLTLDPTQYALVTGLVDIQRPGLYEMVDRRRDIATQLRRFIAGETITSTEVLSQALRYGQLDGELVYNYATNLAHVGQTLSSAQQADLAALRKLILGNFDLIPEPYAYRYSDRIAMPTIPNTDFLFLSSAPPATSTPTSTSTPPATSTPPTVTSTPTNTSSPTASVTASPTSSPPATSPTNTPTTSVTASPTVTPSSPTLTPTNTATTPLPTLTPTDTSLATSTSVPPTATITIPTVTATTMPNGTPTATTTPVDGPTLFTNYLTGALGSTFVISGTGFQPNQSLQVLINGTIISATITSDSAGAVSFMLMTDLNAEVGIYIVTLRPIAGVAQEQAPRQAPTAPQVAYQLIRNGVVREAPAKAPPTQIHVPITIQSATRVYLPVLVR